MNIPDLIIIITNYDALKEEKSREQRREQSMYIAHILHCIHLFYIAMTKELLVVHRYK